MRRRRDTERIPRARRISRRNLRRVEAAVAILLTACFATQSYASVKKIKKVKTPPYAVTTNNGKAPTFSVTNVAPGDFGSQVFTVKNVGTKAGHIQITWTPTVRSALDKQLQLSIYDVTAKQCIWPPGGKPRQIKYVQRVKVKVKVHGKTVTRIKRVVKRKLFYPTVNPCPKPIEWTASILRNRNIKELGWKPLQKNGRLTPQSKLVWKKNETHKLQVKWQLPATLGNEYEHLASGFKLTFKATK